MTKKILIVDDEPSISMLVEFNLKRAGYEVSCVFDGEAVFDAISQFHPDLIVLDYMMPKMDGIEVVRRLREQNNQIPVIMLTALQDITERIVCFDYGVDDFMTKPFSPQELIARIHAQFRRMEIRATYSPQDEIIRLGHLTILPAQHEVRLVNDLVELTPKEYELLLFLSRTPGKVLSRQQLLSQVWDYEFQGDTRIVDVHISHLRDKIEKNPRDPEYIITIRSVGYKLINPLKVNPDHTSVV
jgi:two-component system alkaline phosphatase synthesis response regulator PhoP